MPGRTLLVLATALLLLAPLAQAATKPVAYFLKDEDGAIGPPDPGPLPVPLPIGVPQLVLTGEGILDAYDPKLGNLPNGTQPHTRLVTVPGDAVDPVQFLTADGVEHPERIRGYLLVGLWPGQSVVAYGNLTATLYEVTAGGESVALVNASVAQDLNASAVNATALVPPNSTDPVFIAMYELAQVMPLILQPPKFFLLGPVDLNVSATSRLALGLRLDQGSSPAPLPVGATSSIQYDSAYTPSYVVVPWYTPDPPKATTSRSSSSTFSGGANAPGGSSGSPAGPSGGGDQGSNDTPGLAPMALVGLLALAALAGRRRLP